MRWCSTNFLLILKLNMWLTPLCEVCILSVCLQPAPQPDSVLRRKLWAFDVGWDATHQPVSWECCFVVHLYRRQKSDAVSPLTSSGKVFCARHRLSLLLTSCFPRRGQKLALSAGSCLEQHAGSPPLQFVVTGWWQSPSTAAIALI